MRGGRAFGRSVRLAVVLVAIVAVVGCGRSSGRESDAASARHDDGGAPWFVEVPIAASAERSEPWPDGTFDLFEIMGSGVGLFDADGDGDLDLLHARFPPPGAPASPAPNRFYRRQADGTYVDDTDASGLGDAGFGQGMAIADADDDGDLDVYFTNYGRDGFYLNDGTGVFRDATIEAGFTGDRWSTAAAFCDTDRDGDLDLFVVHYVVFEAAAACVHPSQDVEDYCGPQNFKGVTDALYENLGDGLFRDVTERAGIVLPEGGARAKGLGTVCVDLTGDGWPDLYVANDGEPNQLWVNRGDGTFVDEGIMRGASVNADGNPEASMGVALGDVDRDGRADLFMTHLHGEHNTLYVNREDVLFTDRTAAFRLTEHDLESTGFGCGLFDADNDGDLDLAVANGRVYRERVHPGAAAGPFWNQFAEPNFFFENDGEGAFVSRVDHGGPLAGRVDVSRGMAFGDLDDDGDLDVVVSNLDNTARIYRNDAPREGRHWLRVRARVGRRDAIGARIALTDGRENEFVAHVLPSSSYLSSHDPRVHFGLGDGFRPERIAVDWPDGTRETFAVTGLDREIEIVRGEGESR